LESTGSPLLKADFDVTIVMRILSTTRAIIDGVGTFFSLVFQYLSTSKSSLSSLFIVGAFK